MSTPEQDPDSSFNKERSSATISDSPLMVEDATCWDHYKSRSQIIYDKRAWLYLAYLLFFHNIVWFGSFWLLVYTLFFGLMGIVFGLLTDLFFGLIQFVTCSPEFLSPLQKLVKFLLSIPFNLFVDIKSAAAVLDVATARALFSEDKLDLLVAAEEPALTSNKLPSILTRLWQNLDRYLFFMIFARPLLGLFGTGFAIGVVIVCSALIPLSPFGLSAVAYVGEQILIIVVGIAKGARLMTSNLDQFVALTDEEIHGETWRPSNANTSRAVYYSGNSSSGSDLNVTAERGRSRTSSLAKTSSFSAVRSGSRQIGTLRSAPTTESSIHAEPFPRFPEEDDAPVDV